MIPLNSLPVATLRFGQYGLVMTITPVDAQIGDSAGFS